VRLGVSGVPTPFFNGRRDCFGDAVNDLIQPKKPITKAGTAARAEADRGRRDSK
jgi:hypothetical protein